MIGDALVKGNIVYRIAPLTELLRLWNCPNFEVPPIYLSTFLVAPKSSYSCVTFNHSWPPIQCLNVMVVVADTASVHIPELEFEIPAGSQKGSVSTVEGILVQAAAKLEREQPLRKVSG